jgi:hypothetical protein
LPIPHRVKNGPGQLDNLEQEQDEDDGEDEAKAAAAVVAESWTHAVATKAEHQNQHDQKDEHFLFLRCGEDFAVRECDAGLSRFVTAG